MPTLSDLRRTYLLKMLGLSSSTLTESDLLSALQSQQLSGGLASNRYYQAGRYYSPEVYASPAGTLAATLNTMYLIPFVVGQRQTFDQIGVRVTVGGGVGNTLRFGIYNDTGGLPSTLIAGSDTGAIASETAGAFVTGTLTGVILNPGLYYLAVVNQGGTAATIRAYSAIQTPYISFTGDPDSGAFGMYDQLGIAGALPASATPIIQALAIPRLLMRAA